MLLGLFQSIYMATYLVMGSDSLIGDNCIVLDVYEDIIIFVCFIFLDVAIIATSNNS